MKAELKPEHKQWVDLVVGGMSHQEAYLLIYPNASKKTAGNQLGNFRKNLGLMGYLDAQSRKIAAKVEAKTVEKLSDVETGIILTQGKKREILAQIALGEIEFEKMVMVKDMDSESSTFGKLVWRKMKIKPNASERMKAIDLDNRMTGELFRPKNSDDLPGDDDITEEELFRNTQFVFRTKNDSIN